MDDREGDIKEKAVGPLTDEDALADSVDHESLARLVATRAEPPPLPPAYAAPPDFQSASPRPKSRSPLIVSLLICLALVTGAGIFYIALDSAPPEDPGPVNLNLNVNQPNNNQQNPHGTYTSRKMIAIPGGTFQMGRSGGLIQEGPAHTVTVKGFIMDNIEVTNAEYAEFVREMKYAPPSGWSNGQPLPGQEQWPVSNVSVDDARAFAAWRSKREGVTYRLPTEEEWEYAARNGEQSSLYPWGNEWASRMAVVDEASPKPVGSFPAGKNRWGVLDLLGNVWEWTSSKAAYYPGNSMTVSPNFLDAHVYRGGSYATTTKERPATSALRDWQRPTTKHATLGFRLVSDGQ